MTGAGLLANDDHRLRAFWHPVCRAAAVGDEPLGVRLLSTDLVVGRLNGEVAVLPDRCPHRWTPLSQGQIVDDTFQCPYHGWRFGADGRCALIPALGADGTIPPKAHVTAPQVREAYGLVWVALDEPRAELPEVPEWAAPGIVPVWLDEVDVRCGAAQFTDNFLDFAHFPFVHTGTFGADEAEEIGHYDVEPRPEGFRVRYEHTIANREDPLVSTGQHELLQPRCMEYTFRVPFACRLRLEYPMTGVENTILTVPSPIDGGTTRLFNLLLRNDIAATDSPDAHHAAAYEMSVLAEDIVILEGLGTANFAIDATTQVHTRVDRNMVEFRRQLSAALEEVP
jgi:vanillate O-demethylase monooxygenase subunit